ncbi:hypothetical protein CJO79_00330 [Ralstonia solanacearum]|nr:hypothetical protein CJO76_00330 [Ralstonia solanacearum]AXV89562.1 hypothetical protein CJO79_00330 [Ralstonia solanacearum]AXW17770.1 hypothetical protein CJO85_00330 [Ralstonia solanacearum]AXW74475.1 hypothetical protein CJO97_00330 [Ralstonia solanacearum]
MPRIAANALAKKILAANESAGSRYFSNRDFSRFDGVMWEPMTESTFDFGIIVSSDSGKYFCLWFEDED